jgi:hypothetical protein
MGKWEYLISMETATGPDAASEVLNKWRIGLKELGRWSDDEDDGWELVSEHYLGGQGHATYRGTFKRPLHR